LWSFTYRAEWCSSPDAFPLSPWFPLSPDQQTDRRDDRRVEWYFDNLLPEGGVRRALATFADLDERDTFGLLRRFGEESAGALTLLPTETVPPPPSANSYVPLTRDEVRSLLVGLPRVPLLVAQGRVKMSLAGAQHKLGVRALGDELFLPASGAASSHILKPDNARPETYPFCPANEHLIMSIARAVGIPVPATKLLHLPEPVYLIERYDRWLDAQVVRRRHQIDLCQIANKWPAFKYEADGGATLSDVFAATELVRQPAVAKNHLLRWLVFNYIVGNSDAHAKNVSFLVSREGFDLAPFYDLLSVKVYGDETLAMSIGGEERYGLVTSVSWDALTEQLGIRATLLRRILRELARDIPRAAAKLIHASEYTPDERRFLERVIAVVREHAAFVEDGL
jgi:serine/threonine-protein kinase HipA